MCRLDGQHSDFSLQCQIGTERLVVGLYPFSDILYWVKKTLTTHRQAVSQLQQGQKPGPLLSLHFCPHRAGDSLEGKQHLWASQTKSTTASNNHPAWSGATGL